jgi:hypothetical protein
MAAVLEARLLEAPSDRVQFRRFRPQSFEHLHAVQLGKLEIQYDQVWLFRAHSSQGSLPILADANLEALPDEDGPQQPQNNGIVVDHEQSPIHAFLLPSRANDTVTGTCPAVTNFAMTEGRA